MLVKQVLKVCERTAFESLRLELMTAWLWRSYGTPVLENNKKLSYCWDSSRYDKIRDSGRWPTQTV